MQKAKFTGIDENTHKDWRLFSSTITRILRGFLTPLLPRWSASAKATTPAPMSQTTLLMEESDHDLR